MWVFLLFAAGVAAAVPLAVGACALAGGVLTLLDWLTTRCPGCRARRCMRSTNGIRTTYPTGTGTGTFYRCRACGRRSFWSNDDRAWRNGSSPDFDWAFR